MGKAAEKIKDILGIEGGYEDTIKPAINYTSASIMLGGAGYPISQFHSQYLFWVEKLSQSSIGRISLINGLWDAFNDPVMGIISDRTRSKHGRHRPYLLAAAIPFSIGYLMRWFSFGISGANAENSTAVFLWYLLAAVVYSTSYTIASIPYTSMLPSVAPTYFLRTQYKTVEYIMNSVGQVSSYLFTSLVLSNFNIKTMLSALPEPSPADRNKYMLVGIVLAVWFFWPLIHCFRHTSEPSSLGVHNEPFSMKYLINEYKLIFSNRSFRQYFAISLFYTLSRQFYLNSNAYFMRSVAGKYDIFITMNLVSGVAEALGTPVNYMLVKNKGKTFCGKLLGPLMIIGLILNRTITQATPNSVATVILAVSAVFYNFGFSGPGFVGDNIQPDVIDADELITGRRREGVVGTFKSLFSKTVTSFASYFIGKSLDMFGYSSDKPAPSDQTAKSLFGLRLNAIYMPIVCASISIFSIFRYAMTKKDHELIRRIVAERKEKGFVENITDAEIVRIEKITGQKFNEMWIGQRSDPIVAE